jgi:glycosyltransferase involved in cell wall biosynthesis
VKITVIIPTYNRVATLPHAIRSLLKQKADVDLDILVIDDGSIDETPALLAELCQCHNELRVVRQNNAGIVAARNTGLANLHRDANIVTFLDSDDLSVPNRFAADLPHFTADPALEITYGRMLMVDSLDYENLCPSANSQSVDIVGIQLASAIYRRSLIERIGRFDPDLPQGEDTDYLLRIFEANTNFLQTDTRCVYYLRHPGNISRKGAELRRGFAQAIHKSMLRRKADPSIRLNKPDFEVQALRNVGFL